jgi:SOS-response transcriptional repressor LexA
MSSVPTTQRGEFALFEVHLPERQPTVCGVLVWTHEDAAMRFRRDWTTFAGEEDREAVEAFDSICSDRLRELGPVAFREWAYSTLSNVLRLSDPEPALIDSLPRALDRLYRRHVPAEVLRYRTHLPVVALAAAAGSWGESMNPESLAEQAEDWIEPSPDQRLDERMFVAQVVGRSMEPEIPDGSLCIFRYRPVGSRDGRKVLVERFGDASQRYTVKRYRSLKSYDEEGSVVARKVRLEPLNPEFEAWELVEGEECRVLAEFVSVL